MRRNTVSRKKAVAADKVFADSDLADPKDWTVDSIWSTRGGDEIRIGDMSTRHLINCLLSLHRAARGFDEPWAVAIHPAVWVMIREMRRRKGWKKIAQRIGPVEYRIIESIYDVIRRK